jgi:hypothetical protein
MGTVILPTSPWTFYAVTGGQNYDVLYLAFSITFTGTWAPADPLTGGQTFRDPRSPYTRVAIGALNQDGSPAPGTKVVTVPLGTTNFTSAQLHSVGLDTIADVTTAPQITALS